MLVAALDELPARLSYIDRHGEVGNHYDPSPPVWQPSFHDDDEEEDDEGPAARLLEALDEACDEWEDTFGKAIEGADSRTSSEDEDDDAADS